MLKGESVFCWKSSERGQALNKKDLTDKKHFNNKSFKWINFEKEQIIKFEKERLTWNKIGLIKKQRKLKKN